MYVGPPTPKGTARADTPHAARPPPRAPPRPAPPPPPPPPAPPPPPPHPKVRLPADFLDVLGRGRGAEDHGPLRVEDRMDGPVPREERVRGLGGRQLDGLARVGHEER